MSTIPRCWYTSDLHFGHVKILDYEPSRYDYLDLSPVGPSGAPALIEEMNEALVKLWNDQVAPEDHVVVLGDICMGQIDVSMEYVKRLNGTRELVMGNHDRVHPSRKNKPALQERMEDLYRSVGFDLMYLDAATLFDGILAEVNHFPYEGDNTGEDRYPEFRPTDNGRPLVHGHVHGMWQTNSRQYNVGIDAWNGEFRIAEQIGDYFRSLGFTS